MSALIQPTVRVVTCTPDPEGVIAHAARTCYDSLDRSTPERDAALIRDAIRRGHESILEHAAVTFEITGSRVLTHELVRHRIAAYSQRSQRFVNESEPSYFLPPEIAELAANDTSEWTVINEFETAMDEAWGAYRALLKKGVPKQIARYVLPNACLTTIVATWNLREIRHVVRLRAAREAQPEFQEVAREVLRLASEVAPNVFADLLEKVEIASGR